jgi:hypothetical protein
MLAERVPDVPVLAVTASEPLLLKAAGELGDGYGLRGLVCIAKPVGAEALRAFLAHAGMCPDAAVPDILV